MKQIFISLALLISTAIGAQNLNQAISDVKEKFAPDKRTALFTVETVETNGPVVLRGETTDPDAKTTILKYAKDNNIEVFDAIKVLPDTEELDGKVYGVVNVSVSTVRYGASFAAEMATQLLLGTPVKILKKSGWYMLQTPENYIGWASTGGIKTMTEEQYKQYIAAPKVVFLENNGFVYTKADANSEVVSNLVAGNILKNEGTSGKYTKVSFPDGRVGYVEKAKTADFDSWKKSTRPTADNIIKTAYRFMGVPYLWAGTSSNQLDCSGFAKTVYMLNGLILARDASQQCYTGVEVDVTDGYKNLQKGDLVFFGTKAKADKKERVTHVGIYIGDGVFIHEAGMVHLTSFNPAHKDIFSQNYVNILVRATRIIGNEDKGLGVTSLEKNPLFAPSK